MVVLLASPLMGVPVVVPLAPPHPGSRWSFTVLVFVRSIFCYTVVVVQRSRWPHRWLGSRWGVRSCCLWVCGDSGSVCKRRMYVIKSLSQKALWNWRDIRGGRLSEKVLGQI